MEINKRKANKIFIGTLILTVVLFIILTFLRGN